MLTAFSIVLVCDIRKGSVWLLILSPAHLVTRRVVGSASGSRDRCLRVGVVLVALAVS